MKHLSNYEVVGFDSLEELFGFVDEGGNAQYETNDGGYRTIKITSDDKLYIDEWGTQVTEEDLSYIVGFKTII